MAYILHIETATKNCSVGLSCFDKLIALKEENSSKYSHSSSLTIFVEAVLKESQIACAQLAAVAVSMGPGSYTGLRIGVSAAKGLCFALNIPLIAVNTLALIASIAKSRSGNDEVKYFVPMIDARRQEVYSAVFDQQVNQISKTSAIIIEAGSFDEFLGLGKTVFCGDGAQKCSKLVSHPNAVYMPEVNASALAMPALAFNLFRNKKFESLAYFEPFYLKDFVPGKLKIKGID